MAQTSTCITPSGSHTKLHAHVPAAISTVPISTHIAQPVPAPIDPEKVATVMLGDEEFAFDRTAVDDPPAKHFSEDIDGLFKQWNDSNLLVVNGRGIPIKYWPQFYQAKKGIKSGAWKAIRVEWGNWKVMKPWLSIYDGTTHFLVPSLLLKSAISIATLAFSGPSSVTLTRVNGSVSSRSSPF